MDIVVGSPIPVKMDSSEGKNVTLPGKRELKKERRKSKQDRRRSVREGIFVSLSTKNDRRITKDRRKISL